MKNILFYAIVLSILIGAFTSCEKMDNTYKEFLIPGGLSYPQRVDTPVIYAGKSRVKIFLQNVADPSVQYAKIFWNNYSDSIKIPFSSSSDKVSLIIDNLPEDTYFFVFKTYDAEGRSSVPLEVSASTYGERFQSTLSSRPIEFGTLTNQGNVVIKFGDEIPRGAITTQIKYRDKNDKQQIRYVPIGANSDTIYGIKPGTLFEYRTGFIPDSLSIDTFYSDYQKLADYKINKEKWTASADSYEKTGQLPNGAPSKTIDNDPETYWHTDHTTTKPNYPHWLEVDMQESHVVTRIALTSRYGYYTSDFVDFTIQGSMDGISWTDYDSYALPDERGHAIFFDVTGTPRLKYVRIYMPKDASQPHYYTHLAEFSVYGY